LAPAAAHLRTLALGRSGATTAPPGAVRSLPGPVPAHPAVPGPPRDVRDPRPAPARPRRMALPGRV